MGRKAKQAPAKKATGVRRTFLREHRLKSGLTQTELGARAGYTQGMISQWEKGASIMDLEHVAELAMVLGITPRELLYRDPGQPESIVDVYDNLPEEEQVRVLEIAKTLRRTSQG